MDKRLPSDNYRIDPDPFTIAAVCLASVSLVGQFVQIYKAFHPSKPPENPGAAANRNVRLDALEAQVNLTRSHLDRLIRTAERGSGDPESELYNAPVRVAQTHLMLDPQQIDQFGGRLAELFSAVGGLSIWIHSTAAIDPVLAGRLGERISGFSNIANQVNHILSEGRPVRDAIGECKTVLSELANAIEQELRRGN